MFDKKIKNEIINIFNFKELKKEENSIKDEIIFFIKIVPFISILFGVFYQFYYIGNNTIFFSISQVMNDSVVYVSLLSLLLISGYVSILLIDLIKNYTKYTNFFLNLIFIVNILLIFCFIPIFYISDIMIFKYVINFIKSLLTNNFALYIYLFIEYLLLFNLFLFIIDLIFSKFILNEISINFIKKIYVIIVSIILIIGVFFKVFENEYNYCVNIGNESFKTHYINDKYIFIKVKTSTGTGTKIYENSGYNFEYGKECNKKRID